MLIYVRMDGQLPPALFPQFSEDTELNQVVAAAGEYWGTATDDLQLTHEGRELDPAQSARAQGINRDSAYLELVRR